MKQMREQMRRTSGVAQPHAQEHSCRAGSVCIAVVDHCVISQVRPVQHTVILESLQRCAFYPRPRRPHAAPPSAQPSRGSSPQQRGSTERQMHCLQTHCLHPVSQDALSR